MRHDDKAAWTGFYHADRVCRETGATRGSSYLARGGALGRLGDSVGASKDIERALWFGSDDPIVLEAAFLTHPSLDIRASAARIIIASDRMGAAHVDAACAFLLTRGQPVILHGRRIGHAVSGWIVGEVTDVPRLSLTLDNDSPLALPLEAVPIPHWPIRRWRFEAAIGADAPVRLDARSSSGGSDSLILRAPSTAAFWRRKDPIPSCDTAASGLTVLIPIYGDPESLSACLAALERQVFADFSVVIVDDAATDLHVSRLGREFCARVGGVYRRTGLNSGFAAAVNLGLSLCRGGDVLLLNSDVVLPDGAIERLKAAARASGDIGIAAPFSNDAGNTTFPDPLRPGPVLASREALVVDAAAGRINKDRIVDVSSALGSCLYLTRACVDRVGPLSLAYGRGYYEDVDFCLRARERGFRVVAACDVYVRHFSGRSFRAERNALVMRNAHVLETRFPGHSAWDAAHDAADPLRPARAAIEELLTPSDKACVLLLGRKATAGTVMAWRGDALRTQGLSAMRLQWRVETGEVSLAVTSEAAEGPQSLVFVLNPQGRRRLDGYLARLAILRIEVFEPEVLPGAVRAWLDTAGHRIAFVIDGRPSAKALAVDRAVPVDSTRRRRAAATVLPTDAMTATCLAVRTLPLARPAWAAKEGDGNRRCLRRSAASQDEGGAGSAATSGSPQPVACLGILMPSFDVGVENLVIALARAFALRSRLRLVILGRCADEPRVLASGRTWVTGGLSLADVPAVTQSHGVDALFLPYRDRHHWMLEVATASRSRPRAYFDWSRNGLPCVAGDLAFAPQASNAAVCAGLLAWAAAQPCDLSR